MNAWLQLLDFGCGNWAECGEAEEGKKGNCGDFHFHGVAGVGRQICCFLRRRLRLRCSVEPWGDIGPFYKAENNAK